jgi:hypothetical protein
MKVEGRAPEEGANIILGHKGKPLPEGVMNIGMTNIKIPNEAQQRAGFKLTDVELSKLIQQFPDYGFKTFKPKGE